MTTSKPKQFVRRSKIIILASLCTLLYLWLMIHNAFNLREFGMYSNTECAYEMTIQESVVVKKNCPAQMPDKYNSHYVAPKHSVVRL